MPLSIILTLLVTRIEMSARIALFLAGGACLYAALFLYEDEQNRLQSLLEDLWIRISDLRRSRRLGFMREIARLSAIGFDRLFGRRLFSVQAVAVSACYSIASVCLVVAYRVYSYDEMVRREMRSLPKGVIFLNTPYADEYGASFLPGLVIMGIAFLVLGTLPVLQRWSRLRYLWSPVVLVFVLLAAGRFYLWEYHGWFRYFERIRQGTGVGHTSILWENAVLPITEDLVKRPDFGGVMLAGYCLGLGAGVASDFLFIVLTRRVLQWVSRTESFRRTVASILLNCILGIALCFVPAILGYGTAFAISGRSTVIPGREAYPESYTVAPFSVPIFAQALQAAGYVGSLSNVITSLSASVFILVAVAALAHRLLWPVVERPLYALQQLGVIRRRKLLGTAGILLVGSAFGITPSWLKDLVSGFSG